MEISAKKQTDAGKPVVTVVYNTTDYVLKFRVPLIMALQESGYKVVVLSPTDEATPALVRLGIAHRPIPMSSYGLNPFEELKSIIRISAELRALQPVASLHYTIKPNVFGTIAAKRAGVPVIANVAGLGTTFLSRGWLNRIVRMLYRFAFRHPKVVFFQNQDDQRTFLGLGLVREDQARLLPGSGVDLTRFSPQPIPTGNGVTFLLVARMLWDKGVGEFVEAAKRIRQEFPEVRFQLLGAVDTENPRAIARETLDIWMQENLVEYLGQTDDVRPYIADADCVVLPSYYPEGTPRSLLEAAAMARPVITTDAPGCRNVVNDGVTGFLCEPRSIESLVESIEKFITLSHARRTEMGHLGRQKMEHEYDETIVISAYRQAIEELTRSEHN